MAKRRMRKMAKKVAQQPKHKKMMAEFVASRMHVQPEEIKEMLIKGHRGLLALSEEKLGKKFDEIYDKLNSDLENISAKTTYSGWEANNKESEIKRLKELIAQADVVYDEIFEDTFL